MPCNCRSVPLLIRFLCLEYPLFDARQTPNSSLKALEFRLLHPSWTLLPHLMRPPSGAHMALLTHVSAGPDQCIIVGCLYITSLQDCDLLYPNLPWIILGIYLNGIQIYLGCTIHEETETKSINSQKKDKVILKKKVIMSYQFKQVINIQYSACDNIQMIFIHSFIFLKRTEHLQWSMYHPWNLVYNSQ